MVRPSPDVKENQRPEVDDGKPIGVNRAIGCLRQEVVHQAQVWRRQEEGYRIVAVPPLHQRVLHSGINRVAFK